MGMQGLRFTRAVFGVKRGRCMRVGEATSAQSFARLELWPCEEATNVKVASTT